MVKNNYLIVLEVGIIIIIYYELEVQVVKSD